MSFILCVTQESVLRP